MKSAQTLQQLTLNDKEFILSSAIRPCGKVGFYAHELGELTQWCKVFGGEERKAYRINPSMRVKGRRYISKPYTSEQEALKAIEDYSKLNVHHF